MGMSINVIGFAPPDEKWQQMKAIWDSCQAAGIAVPREVERFFNDCDPDERGVEVDVPTIEFRDDYREGYEIEIDKIPKHVKVIRFYCSW
jgi:hypothetical protein